MTEHAAANTVGGELDPAEMSAVDARDVVMPR